MLADGAAYRLPQTETVIRLCEVKWYTTKEMRKKKIGGFNIEEQGSLCRSLTDLVHAHVRLRARRLQWIIVLKIILSVHKTPEQLRLCGLESVATACFGGNLNSE